MRILRVGVTFPVISEYEMHSSYKNYLAWLESVGIEAVPFFVDIDPRFKGIRGILLTGGGDIDPTLYGEENRGSKSVSRERDEFELKIIDKAFKEKLPIFAICRGQQILNVYFGGTLYQDLDMDRGIRGHQKRGKDDAIHEITIEPSTNLHSILGSNLEVNSSHHQAVKNLGKELKISARALDGTVEALEVEGHPEIISIQWHPERWDRPSSLKLLNYFLSLL